VERRTSRIRDDGGEGVRGPTRGGAGGWAKPGSAGMAESAVPSKPENPYKLGFCKPG